MREETYSESYAQELASTQIYEKMSEVEKNFDTLILSNSVVSEFSKESNIPIFDNPETIYLYFKEELRKIKVGIDRLLDDGPTKDTVLAEFENLSYKIRRELDPDGFMEDNLKVIEILINQINNLGTYQQEEFSFKMSELIRVALDVNLYIKGRKLREETKLKIDKINQGLKYFRIPSIETED